MPAPPIGALELELYETDRVTVAWAVGDDPAHVAPYLVTPDKYEQQEIDPAACTATIGTITVAVIDPAQVPGDQDSGWMTERLSALGVAAVAGRRCRLRRWLGAAWQTVLDGIAGTPKLAADYASYEWEIRDVREIERKLVAFGGSTDDLVLFPRGLLATYGDDPALPAPLMEPVVPVVGTVVSWSNLSPGTVALDLAGHGNTADQLAVFPTQWTAMQGDKTVLGGFPMPIGTLYRTTFGGRIRVWWRVQNTGDPAHPYPWHVLDSTLCVAGYDQNDPGKLWLGPVGFAPNAYGQPADDGSEATVVLFGDTRAIPDVPGVGQVVEVLVLTGTSCTVSTATPFHLEGLTAGQFAQNCYDGLYSERGPLGEVVPSGIRYDAAALAQMTTPVRLRLMAPIPDVRAFLEKSIYVPTGWIPALDTEGRVSPVSQVPPNDTAGLPVIDDAIAEPAPDWDAGATIKNLLRVKYSRDYLPTNGADAATGEGLSEVTVVIEYVDQPSIDLHGEQVLEIDGSAFRAVTDSGVGAAVDLLQEQGWLLAAARQQTIGARYALGAPAFRVAVMRAALPTLRAGDWVVVNLSWLPDYVSGRRGLVALAQALSIGDLDAAWRQLLLEQVTVLAS